MTKPNYALWTGRWGSASYGPVVLRREKDLLTGKAYWWFSTSPEVKGDRSLLSDQSVEQLEKLQETLLGHDVLYAFSDDDRHGVTFGQSGDTHQVTFSMNKRTQSLTVHGNAYVAPGDDGVALTVMGAQLATVNVADVRELLSVLDATIRDMFDRIDLKE
jgi:hypothetical protein